MSAQPETVIIIITHSIDGTFSVQAVGSSNGIDNDQLAQTILAGLPNNTNSNSTTSG